MSEFLKNLLVYYQTISSKAGLSLDCLDKDSDKFGKTEVDVELENNAVNVRLFGPIDRWWGFNVKNLLDHIDEQKDVTSINLQITSPGGNVFDGMALYSYLRKRAGEGVAVTTEAHGLAASIASVIFAAGDERLMGDGAQLMVHNPHGMFFVVGDLEDVTKQFNKLKNSLKSNQDNLVSVLAARSGNTKKSVTEMMNEETWFNAEDSVEKGFATGLINSDEADDDEEDIDDSIIDALQSSYRDIVLNSIKRGI